MKLSHIDAENFLGIRRASVQLLAPITLIVGPNGAGKSSLSEAVRMALTGEPVRVARKNEYSALVHDDQKAGFAEVGLAGGGSATITLPGGKAAASGYEAPSALPYVLNAQRFATLDTKERAAFLFGLMGVQRDPAAINARLLARGCNAAKVERIAPLLRAGMEAGSKEAKTIATTAKGVWRGITGENYGSEKAKTWRAAVPAVDTAAARELDTELQHCDVALEQWQQQVGKLQAEEQRRTALSVQLPGLHTKGEALARAQAKLAVDEAGLAEWVEKVRATEALVTGVADMPHFACPNCGATVMLVGTGAGARLEHYVKPAGTFDEGAAALLPRYREARALQERAVANDRRDIEVAQAAIAEADLIKAELAAEFDAAALDAARAQIEELKERRGVIVKRLDASKAAKQQADAADRKTKEATTAHIDVQQWEAIGDALAPDGIPGELLAEALAPINDRLTQSALDSEWPRVEIAADMQIRVGIAERAYALLSESERWRVDAMVAEAVSHLSGVRLLVLDRFDVLDQRGRGDLLAWLDILASNGELDTALVFGTLRAVPSGLPETASAAWIEAGEIVGERVQEAA